MTDDSALVAENQKVLDEAELMALDPERDFEVGLISAMRAAKHRDQAAKRQRFDSDTPLQRHLRQRFLDAQGTSMADSKARELRAENARRYEKWSQTSALNATGNRPV